MTERCYPAFIHGVTEEQASPVAGNGPPLGVQGSRFNVDETACLFELPSPLAPMLTPRSTRFSRFPTFLARAKRQQQPPRTPHAKGVRR